MKLISAKEMFDEARAYQSGQMMDGTPHEKSLTKAELMLNEILSNNIGNDLVLYCLGSLYMERGFSGLAIQILSQVTTLKPQFGEAWNNLGLAFKQVNDWERAALCMREAAKYINHPDIPINIAGMYLNRNLADKALKYADQALAMDPNHVKAQWHKALALLELRQWGTAWQFHEARLQGGANENIGERNYHGEEKTPWWDGKSPGTVVIHGEQGMGDEVMFASCIPDALKTPGATFICEPNPRVEKLFQRSFPGVKVYGTNDLKGERWINELGKPDYKIPLGSLPKFYRTSAEAFPGTPYLVPDKNLRAYWGDKLRVLGPKPKIGIAWQGGVPTTRVDARSVHPLTLGLLWSHNVDWISLQYDDTAQHNVAEVKEKFGVKLHHWPKAVEAINPETGKPSDLDELAALISKLDLVISVCQTAIHFAGALGVPCWCLTPSQPSWRYGAVEAADMPWYRSVTLIRQQKGSTDWTPVIQETSDRLGRFLQQKKAA